MLQENNRNIFPVSCVLSSLSDISDHGDCFIIANCLTETPEHFEVYSEFSGIFQSVCLFILQLHAELLTMISGTMVGKCSLMMSEHRSFLLSSSKMPCMYSVNICTWQISYIDCRYNQKTFTCFREFEIRDTVPYVTKLGIHVWKPRGLSQSDLINFNILSRHDFLLLNT
jgi:hypothetical protein